MRIVAMFFVTVFMILVCGRGYSESPPVVETVIPTDLCKEALADKPAAERKYKGKTVELSAKVFGSGSHVADGPYATLLTGNKDFIVCPWFDKNQEKTVLALKKGQVVFIRGKVSGFTVIKKDGSVFFSLDDCVVLKVEPSDEEKTANAQKEAAKQKAKAADNEAKAAGSLGFAREYAKNGKTEMAIEKLQILIKDYPDTEAAAEAKVLLEKIKR